MICYECVLQFLLLYNCTHRDTHQPISFLIYCACPLLCSRATCTVVYVTLAWICHLCIHVHSTMYVHVCFTVCFWHSTIGSLCCPSASLTSTAVFSTVTSSDMNTPSPKPYDRLSAFICVYLFFIVLFVFAVFETLGSPLTMDEFAWTKKQAVLYNNMFYAGLAALAIVTFMLVKLISKK